MSLCITWKSSIPILRLQKSSFGSYFTPGAPRVRYLAPMETPGLYPAPAAKSTEEWNSKALIPRAIPHPHASNHPVGHCPETCPLASGEVRHIAPPHPMAANTNVLPERNPKHKPLRTQQNYTTRRVLAYLVQLPVPNYNSNFGPQPMAVTHKPSQARKEHHEKNKY
ncbi:MAG: hypothetical protein MI747_04710 [Desulfobacterales bacterium]|nr:hypothetical protein [Desulfobacterales bacterium]